MPDWWPFGKRDKVDPEALFREAEAALRQELAAKTAAGVPRQTLLNEIESEAKRLEQGEQTAAERARLRALDYLFEELRPAMLANLSEGKMHEMAGRVDEAIPCYETAVADQVATRFPYEHLRVIYNRREQYDHSLRICRAALDNPHLSSADQAHFDKWAGRLEAHLAAV